METPYFAFRNGYDCSWDQLLPSGDVAFNETKSFSYFLTSFSQAAPYTERLFKESI